MRGKRTLRIALAVLALGALLGAAGSALQAWLVPAGIRLAAERAVREAAGELARVQDVRVSLWRGHIALARLEVRGLALGGHQVDVAADEVRLHVRRRALLRGTLEVGSVTLARPVLAVRAAAAAAPPEAGLRILAAPLGAHSVTVRDGRATYEDASRGLRIEAVGLGLVAVRRPDGVEVSLRVAEGRVAAAGRTLGLGPLAGDGVWHPGGQVEVASLSAAGLGSTVKGRGWVGLKGWPPAAPIWDLAVEGILDAAEVAALAGAGVPASGHVGYVGVVKGAGRDVAFEGELKASTVTLGPHTLRSLAGRAAVDGRRARWSGLRAALWDGAVRLNGTCLWASGRCEAQWDAMGIDLAQAVPGAGVHGHVGGAGTFAGIPGRAETQRITLAARGREMQVGPVPLGGVSLEGRVEGNRLEAEGSAGGGAVPFRLSGPWQPNLAMDVGLGPVDARALGALLDQPGLGGTLQVGGTLAGAWADPSFRGRIAWAPAEAAGVAWDSAEGVVEWGAGRLRVESATLRAGRTVLALRGMVRPGPRVDTGGSPPILDLAGEGEGAVEDLARMAGPGFAAAGHFRATVRIRGSLRRPEGEAQLALRDLVLWASRWERGEARARLVAGAVRLEAASLGQGAARVEARGEVAPGGRLALDVTASDLDVGALAGSPGLRGRLGGKGRVTGTAADPAVDATVRLTGVAWEGLALGDLRGRLTHARGRTELGVRQDGGGLTLTGVLPGAAEGTADLSITVQEMDASPLLARAGDPRLAGGQARAGGTAHLKVPLSRPQEATGEARLAPAQITLAGETWRAEEPVELRLAPGGLHIPGADLRGRLGILRVSGVVRRDAAVDLSLQGPIPLATAALWAPGIEGTGAAVLDLVVSGRPGDAEARGTVQVVAGRLRIPGIPLELERVEGPVVLVGREATLGPARATLAGGALTGSGRLRRLSPGEQEHHWALRLDGADGARLVGLLAPGSAKITGTAAGTAELTFVGGEGADPLRRLSGQVQLRFQDGRIFQGSMLGRVLEVVNVAPLRRWRLPDLKGEGMPYREVTAEAHLQRGVAEVQALRLESDTVRMAGAGSVDLGTREVQMLVAVRPLGTLDDVVSRVPLLGPALVGKEGGVVTLTYEVSGPLDDPEVRLAGARTVGRNLLDRLRKFLE